MNKEKRLRLILKEMDLVIEDLEESLEIKPIDVCSEELSFFYNSLKEWKKEIGEMIGKSCSCKGKELN